MPELKLSPKPLVHLTLTALPPSANHLFATVRNRRIKTRAYQQWLDGSLWEVAEQRQRPAPGWVAIGYIIQRPRGSRRIDVSNRIKPLEDLVVTAGLIEDDSWVWATSATWTTDPGAVVDIQIWGIDKCSLGGLPAA